MPWTLPINFPGCSCQHLVEHVTSAAIASGAVTTSAFVCRKCNLWFGGLTFCLGLGFGLIAKEWLLWNSNRSGFYNELIRRLSIIEAQLRELKYSDVGMVSVGPISRLKRNYSSMINFDDEDFQDARSRRSSADEDDDFLSAPSDNESVSGSGDSKTAPSLLFREIDRLLDGSMTEKEEAYRLCLSKQDKYKNNCQFQWRLAKAIYNCSLSPEISQPTRQQMAYEALEAAKRSVSIRESSGGHKWLAILLGVVGIYEGTQQKILNGFKFREHIDKALVLDPEDYAAQHLLGRWCYGVYMLSWVERKLASTLFATPPTATIDEALTAFSQAEALSPRKWRENELYIAKCHIEKGNYREAAYWLKQASDLPKTDDPDDVAAETEVATLLTKYSNYL